MKLIQKKSFEARLPKPVVGCALQGARALAMQVRGDREGWSVDWCLDGSLREPQFVQLLSRSVGSSPFWVAPTRRGGAMSHFALQIEIPDGVEELGGGRVRDQLLRTQVDQRFHGVAEAVVVCGSEVSGPDGDLLVGGGAVRKEIEEDLRNWRKKMRIREPHVASPAVALANLYAQLCPAEVQADGACRIVVAPGEATATAVVMDRWKFVDAIEYQLLEGQRIDQALIRQWSDFVQSAHAGQRLDVVPLVLSPAPDPAGVLKTWDPFANPNVRLAPEAREIARRRLGPACVAFGMAIQGGI